MIKRNNQSFFIDHLPFFLGVLVLLGVSIYRIVLNDVWIDEASSLVTATMPYQKVFHTALIWESQAPLYYLILYLWMQIYPSYFFARVLSLILVSLFIFIIYKIIYRYEKSKLIQSLYLAVVASAYFVILSAVTVRYYSVALLLSVLLIDIFLRRYLNNDPPSVKIRLLFIVLSILAVLTQYYLSIFLLAFGITIWIHLGFKRFIKYGVDMVLPVLTLFALFNIICSQYNVFVTIEEARPSLLGALKFGIKNIESAIINLNYFHDSKIVRHTLRGFFLVVGIALLIYRKNIPKWGYYLLILILINTIGLFVLYFLIHSNFIQFWHILFFNTIILLFLFFAITALQKKWSLIIFSILVLVNLYSAIFFSKPARYLANLNQYLEADESYDENIYIYPNIFEDIFQFQYSGKNELIPLPKAIDYDLGYNLQLYALQGDNQLDSFFTMNRDRNQKSFYLLENRVHNLSHVDFKFQQFDSWLDQNFNLISDTTFTIYRLRKFRY
ncbi:MAG: hypothetical protein K9H64_01860 [Bacteroidales bacterium]|nr:hypothetical protein [Bacteroidales bacterium]MCF8454709.1 hypothetical protein [Bacteroidales bacterium]